MSDSQLANTSVLSFHKLIKLMPPRNKDSHKGDFGHTLFVGGDHGFSGAIRMSAEAALRVGSGLVSVATRAEHAALIAMSRPELMCHGVEAQAELKALLKRSNVVAIGPGLGLSDWSHRVFELSLDSSLPLVVDADGLNLLAKEPRRQDNWVLTPHPGEAAKLLSCSTADIQQDRLAAVKTLQQQYGGVVVLKGAGSLIANCAEPVFICNAGNPGMATGGMGDVLTGVIAGLIAQGLNSVEAAKLGVMTHAIAGDRAAKKGERGLIASDVIKHLRELVNEH